MIGVKSHASKAIDAVERNRAELARREAALKEHVAAKPPGDDADANYNWRRDRRDLEDRIAAAQEALAFAEARAEQARTEAAERAHDAYHASIEKLVSDTKPLVSRVARRNEEQWADLLKIEEQRKAVEEANRKRGNRPLIVDAETLVRQIPGRVVPEKLRKDVIWLNANGDRATFFRKDTSGELVPTDGSYRRTVVDVVESAEERIPTRTPLRYARALTLVDMAGNPLRLD